MLKIQVMKVVRIYLAKVRFQLIFNLNNIKHNPGNILYNQYKNIRLLINDDANVLNLQKTNKIHLLSFITNAKSRVLLAINTIN